MLRLMLDAHPQLTIPPETWFLPALLEARRSGGRLTPDQVIEILVSERRWEDFGLDAEKLRERFGDAEFVSPRRAARSFYKIYAQQQGKQRWGDKTPEYVLHMASISRALPEARFIHLIRDGRAVFRSRVNRREVKATREALLWSRLIGRARRQAQRVEHYMEVRYEDLVRDPERHLREICDFVELDFDPAMLRYHESAEDRLSEIYRDLPSSNQPGLTAAERRALHRHTVEAPDPELIDRWRTTLTADQIEDYEANAGATLADLGYELLTGGPAPESGTEGAPGNAPSHASKHRELGLTDSELELICEQLGREPNDVELAMFSLLWSEHCAYKHSRKLLGRLPTEGPRVVMGPGENAGAVDVGGGHSVAFKVESHNHPSAVEPFQGAATGVGGILRDVFALGARPIAILDSLRFGELDSPRSRYLFEHVVAGIGHYGNSIGVPTVGGEVYFEAPYEQNCLVNAMCVGLARTEDMVRSAAAGVGNVVVLMGASTGRDGIGGASVLASAELGDGDDAKRPTVQIGDPFEESKLVECCLELLAAGLLVALQDLGAAGLTSSAAEMAAGGGTGIDIDVAKVPLREADMEPFEVMVSESQERMLAVVEPAQVERVIAICEKWQVGPAVIGAVTGNGLFRVFSDDSPVGEMPIAALVDGCPLYDLEPAEPAGWIYGNEATLASAEPAQILEALLAAPSIASKRWAWQQYDPIVGSRTARRPESADAAVLDLPEAGIAIAIAIDGNGRRVACDPYQGAVEAVLECAQNLSCVGAEPLGLTNCLNFGNPEKPSVAWQLERAVQGLADVCGELAIPVVGGNVSLYNETELGPIYPTPVVGLVGELPEAASAGGIALAEGDAIALAGPFAPSVAGSELAKQRGELGPGLAGVDVGEHAVAMAFVRDAVRSGRVSAAHDISDGGLACALAEMAIAGGVGARCDLDGFVEVRGAAGETACFGEGPGGYLLGGPRRALEELAAGGGVDVWLIGEATGNLIELAAAELELSLPLERAELAWRSLTERMELAA